MHTTAEQTTHTNTERATAQRRLRVEVVVNDREGKMALVVERKRKEEVSERTRGEDGIGRVRGLTLTLKHTLSLAGLQNQMVGCRRLSLCLGY